jgi:hypothetical protein
MRPHIRERDLQIPKALYKYIIFNCLTLCLFCFDFWRKSDQRKVNMSTEIIESTLGCHKTEGVQLFHQASAPHPGHGNS